MRGEWPAVGKETLVWRVSGEIADYLGPCRAARLDGQTYARTVPAHIGGLGPLTVLTPEVLERIIEATGSVRHFASRTADLPPFLRSVLLRFESASSSQVERLSASTRTLAESEIGLRNSANAQMISANTAAMVHAFSPESPLTVRMVLSIHEILLGGSVRVRAGVVRDTDVWIGGSDFAPVGADFVGASPAAIPHFLEDLVQFVSSPMADAMPLLTAAIAHAQFETIHPFEDGNGRVGRALTHVILRGSGVVTVSPLPLSAGLLADTGQYFSALEQYRTGDVSAIALVFASAAEKAAVLGGKLADQVQEIRQMWRQRIVARSDATIWGALDSLFSQPVTSIPYLSRELRISDRAAGRALTQLSEAGIVIQSGRDRRQQTWQAVEVLELLDNFAAEAQFQRNATET